MHCLVQIFNFHAALKGTIHNLSLCKFCTILCFWSLPFESHSKIPHRAKGVQLYFSDIASLYRNRGLTDGVIDFFLKYVYGSCMCIGNSLVWMYYRVILPEEVGDKAVSSTLIVSSTAFQAIRRDQLQGKDCKVTATIGKTVDMASKDLVVFPCKPWYGCLYQQWNAILQIYFSVVRTDSCGTGY